MGDERFSSVSRTNGQQACRFGVAGVGADFVYGTRLFYEVFADVVDLSGWPLTLMRNAPSSTVA
jgi:hypothetical protein